jgi:hypothetical protein
VDPLPPPRVKVAIPKPKPRQDSPIGAKKAQALAGSYLQTFLREQRYADVLNDAKRTVGGSALGDAVLVKRADRGKAGYYIVPLMRNSLTIGAILIDAYSGDLLEASFLEQPVRYVEVLAPEPAVRAFREQLPSLELNPALRDFLRSRSVSGTLPKPLAEPISPRSTVRPQAADWTSVLQQMVRRATQPTRPPKPTVVESDELQRQPRDDARTLVDFGIDRDQVKVEQVQLVWKPSAQSQNPYYPSWQIKGSIERMTQPVVLGYVDSRGKLSPRLTPPAELPLNGGGR